jgi:hypothetical protein
MLQLSSIADQNLADREFRCPHFQRPSYVRTSLRARGRSAETPLSCIKDGLLEQFDLSPCVSPGPLRMPASLLQPIVGEFVRTDRF